MSLRPGRCMVYLASASPRRHELLTQIGVPWVMVPAEVDESMRAGESAEDYVGRLARAKAIAARTRPGLDQPAVFVAADTAVVVSDRVLGKPADAAECGRMLGMLSGRTHTVLTAVVVVSPLGESLAVSRSEVSFRDISGAEISAYWRTGEPADKAGAYAIQGVGAVFVKELRGSYSGVMGLPLFETASLLAAHGVPLLDVEHAPP